MCVVTFSLASIALNITPALSLAGLCAGYAWRESTRRDSIAVGAGGLDTTSVFGVTVARPIRIAVRFAIDVFHAARSARCTKPFTLSFGRGAVQAQLKLFTGVGVRAP